MDREEFFAYVTLANRKQEIFPFRGCGTCKENNNSKQGEQLRIFYPFSLYSNPDKPSRKLSPLESLEGVRAHFHNLIDKTVDNFRNLIVIGNCDLLRFATL